MADFDAALRLDANYAPAWAERGRANYLQGDDDAAIHDCGRAIELDPKSGTAYCWRAAALSRKGDQRKAVADCDAALAADPQSALAHAVRGNAYRLLGDLDKAQADCDEAVWLDRQSPWAYLYRGEVYATERRPGKGDRGLYAGAAVRRAPVRGATAVAATPNGSRATWRRRWPTTTRRWRWTRRTRPSFHGRGRALAARGEHEAALAAFDAALKIDPRRAAVYLDRGGERLRGGDRDGGLADFTEAVRLEPARAADVLTAVERRADKEAPAEWCELCRRALAVLRPLLKDKPEAQKAIDAGLAAAAGEKDAERRAAKLRATIAGLRGKLPATGEPGK